MYNQIELYNFNELFNKISKYPENWNINDVS